MHPVIEFFQRLYHFDALIQWGGHAVLVAIVFAETGIMAGFFLPGDSLLVTAGVFGSARVFSVWVLFFGLRIAAVLGDSLYFSIWGRLGAALFSPRNSFFFYKKNL